MDNTLPNSKRNILPTILSIAGLFVVVGLSVALVLNSPKKQQVAVLKDLRLIGADVLTITPSIGEISVTTDVTVAPQTATSPSEAQISGTPGVTEVITVVQMTDTPTLTSEPAYTVTPSPTPTRVPTIPVPTSPVISPVPTVGTSPFTRTVQPQSSSSPINPLEVTNKFIAKVNVNDKTYTTYLVQVKNISDSTQQVRIRIISAIPSLPGPVLPLPLFSVQTFGVTSTIDDLSLWPGAIMNISSGQNETIIFAYTGMDFNKSNGECEYYNFFRYGIEGNPPNTDDSSLPTYPPGICSSGPSTITPTITSTPTITQTPTNTITPTITNTITNTPTNTITSTPLPTGTITSTPTITQTPTVTPTGSLTPSSTPTVTPAMVSIGDFVWDDANDNGLQDSGEGGISEADVQLLRCTDSAVALAGTKTDAQGKYAFTGLGAGCYKVKFYAKSGYSLCTKTTTETSKEAIDSNAGTDGVSKNYDIADGQSNQTIDACMVRPRVVTNLTLTMKADNESPNLWDDVIFYLTVKNTGTNDATGVIVREYLPSGLIYLGHDAVGANPEVYNVNEGMWYIGTVAKGETKELRIKVKVASISRITNIVEIYAMSQGDSNSTPNNLVETEDDYASVALITKTEVTAKGADTPKLADTGIATTLTFGIGSSLLIAAIAIEELRGRTGVVNQNDEDDDE